MDNQKTKRPLKPRGGKRTPFYWWRRFPSHRYLSTKASIRDRIANGDFDYPELFQHARWELEWMEEDQQAYVKAYTGTGDPRTHDEYADIERRYRKRWRLLQEDAVEVEAKRLIALVDAIHQVLGVDKDEIRDRMSTWDGTIDELYTQLRKEYY